MLDLKLKEALAEAELLGVDTVILSKQTVRNILQRRGRLLGDICSIAAYEPNSPRKWPRIEMIKLYRAATGLPLKEAKDDVVAAIETYEWNLINDRHTYHPDSDRRAVQQQSDSAASSQDIPGS